MASGGKIKVEEEIRSQGLAWREKVKCPRFQGETEDYVKWKRRVSDWRRLCGENENTGIEVRMALEGRAMDIAYEMEDEMIVGFQGIQNLIKKLDEVYLQDEVNEMYEKLLKYIKVERERNEEIGEYMVRYERLAEACKRATGEGLKEKLKGCHVLEGARLEINQKQMVLAACGKEGIGYNKVCEIIKRMFGGLRSKVKNEEVWKEGEKRGRIMRERWEGEKRKEKRGEERRRNPMIRGKISRCVICSSIYHWARDCPKNYQNSRYQERKNERREQETKRVTNVREGRNGERGGRQEGWMEISELLSLERKEMSYLDKKGRDKKRCEEKDLRALLDTGCNLSLCGERWFAKVVTNVNYEDVLMMKESKKEESKIFQFGETEYRTLFLIKIPCKLRGREFTLYTHVVEGDLPWIIGREQLMKMGAKIDLSGNKISFRELEGMEVEVEKDERGHLRMEVLRVDETKIGWLESRENRVKRNDEIDVRKLHLQFGHPSSERLIRMLREARRGGERMEERVKKMTEECNICEKYKRNVPRPVVGMPMAKKFNEVVAMDLGEVEGRKFLMMIDLGTKYCQAEWLKDKRSETVADKFIKVWVRVFGVPNKILSDNGGEFEGEEMKRAMENLGIKKLNTAAYSPFSNGICEKWVGLVKDMLRKMNEEGGMSWDSMLDWAIVARNGLYNNKGYTPNQLVFGRNMMLPDLGGEVNPAMLEEVDDETNNEGNTSREGGLYSSRSR